MKTTAFVTITLVATATAAFLATARQSPGEEDRRDAAAPASHWSGALVADLGIVPLNANASSGSHVFELKNIFTKPLKITEAAQDCTCLFVEVPGGWIAPGEMLRLKVRIQKPEHLTDGRRRSRSSVMLQDNESETLKLSIEALWSDSLWLSQPVVTAFAPLHEKAEALLTLQHAKDLRVVSASTDLMLSERPLLFEHQVQETSPGSTAVRLIFGASERACSVTGHLLLHTSLKSHVRVPVTVEYYDRIRIAEPTLYLGRAEPGVMVDVDVPLYVANGVEIDEVQIQGQQTAFKLQDGGAHAKTVHLKITAPIKMGINRLPLEISARGGGKTSTVLILDVQTKS